MIFASCVVGDGEETPLVVGAEDGRGACRAICEGSWEKEDGQLGWGDDGGVGEEFEFLVCVSVVWEKQGVGVMAFSADGA